MDDTVSVLDLIIKKLLRCVSSRDKSKWLCPPVWYPCRWRSPPQSRNSSGPACQVLFLLKRVAFRFRQYITKNKNLFNQSINPHIILYFSRATRPWAACTRLFGLTVLTPPAHRSFSLHYTLCILIWHMSSPSSCKAPRKKYVSLRIDFGPPAWHARILLQGHPSIIKNHVRKLVMAGKSKSEENPGRNRSAKATRQRTRRKSTRVVDPHWFNADRIRIRLQI